MNCPKCGYESPNQQNEVNRCASCDAYWTRWQQERNDVLEAALRKIVEHKHCDPMDPSTPNWAIAHSEGHACCAAIAKKALEAK
jgi:hypothetical protein